MARLPVLALIVSIILMLPDQPLKAQFVTVGSGSYTTTFPGVDAASRDSFPTSGRTLLLVLRSQMATATAP